MGVNNASAIGTLVERATRFVVLLHLGRDRSAEAVCAAMTAKIMTLPGAQFTVETGVRVYFCDPHTPWQPGSDGGAQTRQERLTLCDSPTSAGFHGHRTLARDDHAAVAHDE